MGTNGVSESMKLSEVQLEVLRRLLAPSFGQLQQLEAQANIARQTINSILGAYLEGLGFSSELNVDLATGVLSPVTVAQV